MIKHIVFWKLKDEANGMSKQDNAIAIKQKLEALNGQIEGCIKIEVGFDVLHSAESADVVLYSEFENMDALKYYAAHPLHQAILPFIAEAKSERRVVDMEY
ncbi:MAG: Dabb family protein [Bacteroidia bacterium]|nr:Dabb family protein [Bacteroidia bacterium]